jgi:hypothetical protein
MPQSMWSIYLENHTLFIQFSELALQKLLRFLGEKRFHSLARTVRMDAMRHDRVEPS